MPDPILITGGAGRIGGLLRARLPAHGWSLRACDLRATDAVEAADITDMDAMRRLLRGCRSVIHLAGTPNARPGWAAVQRLNVEGTRVVLEAARREGVAQVLYASSIHTVGALPASTAFGPDLLAAPSGIYGTSKLAAEALLSVYARKAAMRTFALRICSFRPEPSDRRELRTWLGQDDTVHLVDRCLCDETPGYAMIWGVSANTRLEIDDPVARRIGYRPTQDAERFTVANGGTVDGDAPEEWPQMGGPVAADHVVDFVD